MEYGADRETKDFAKTLMNDREQTEKLTGEALAVIFGAVKITRCKDCRHRYSEDGCVYGHTFITDDFFCGYGEPKDEPEAEPEAKTDERRPCVWCWHARDREDVSGVYCTKGFENPDGTCTRFKSYEEMRDKGATE